MKTKKQYKRKNNLTKALRFDSLNGSLRGGDPDLDPDSRPTYMKYTWLVLGMSSAYIFLKLTGT